MGTGWTCPKGLVDDKTSSQKASGNQPVSKEEIRRNKWRKQVQSILVQDCFPSATNVGEALWLNVLQPYLMPDWCLHMLFSHSPSSSEDNKDEGSILAGIFHCTVPCPGPANIPSRFALTVMPVDHQ